MAAKKKYHTEAERKAAQRKQCRLWYLAHKDTQVLYQREYRRAHYDSGQIERRRKPHVAPSNPLPPDSPIKSVFTPVDINRMHDGRLLQVLSGICEGRYAMAMSAKYGEGRDG